MTAGSHLLLFGTARWREPARTIDLADNLPSYLLAYLVVRGDWVSRETLVALFWPDRHEREALQNLRANLHRVRALLKDWSMADALHTREHGLRLALPNDAVAYRRAVGQGNWQQAIELQPEPLLARWSWRGFPLVAEWAHAERAALAGTWRHAALQAALQDELSGQSDAAADTLLRLLEVSQEPPEAAVQALLRVAAGGDAARRQVALAQYERLVHWLREEIGAEPMADTAQWARKLRQPVATPARRAGGRPAGVPRAVLHPPRLVGRDAQCSRLADSACGIAIVSGEPGIGKTRLLEESLPRAVWIACREHLDQVPFGPLAEWIDDQRESLPALGDDRRILARLVPALLDGERLPPADADARARLLQALARLLEACGPALVIDDLQWADPATRELVLLLVRRANVPLRLAYRRDEASTELLALFDALEQIRPVERIVLQALTTADTLRLLAEVSHTDTPPALFGAWLQQHTGGNPFFALQTLRALFESGRLSADAQGWASVLDDITTDYSELQIPTRAAELIRRRVLNASERARRVLTAVAVAGAAHAIDAIAATTGLPAWDCAEAVAELQASGLLHDHRFAHDLVRQSVYRATPPALRTMLHGAVARHFAGVLGDEQIAAHWWQAGDVSQALAATVQACTRQRRSGLQGDALALVTSALARVRESPERARMLSVRARVRLELSDIAGAEADAQAALDEAAAPNDRAEAWLIIASVRLHQGRLDDSERALQAASASDPDHAGLSTHRARVSHAQGRVAEIVPELERRVVQLRRLPPDGELLEALTNLGGAYNDGGDVERALAALFEAYRLAGRLQARYAQVEAAVDLLFGLSGAGRTDEAVAIAQEALALGEYDATPTLRNNLAWALCDLGRVDEAMTLYEQLAAGRDPTLALVARSRLVDLRCSAGIGADDASAMVESLLVALDSTDIYVALVSGCKTVLRHGTRAQIDRALTYLRPGTGIDPWLRRELSEAMAAHGIDPLRHLGAAVDAPPHPQPGSSSTSGALTPH